ncbi:MAG: radical SAM family heme chaperone HemW [Gammaproteobacteria bacterium]
MLELPPLALYVHIPWCARKCPYCDFNSHELTGDIPELAYIEALIKDLATESDKLFDRPLQSIFIGGGTPSLFSAAALSKLLTAIEAQIQFADNIEITLEANPGTAEAHRFSEFRDAGINRLSLGIQSFDDLQLQKLGRIHDSQQARDAIEMAKDAGFDNFNLDLMYGLPGQTVRAAIEDLQVASCYDPPHLSWYQLTIEPNTVFYRRPPELPRDALIEEIEAEGHQLLRDRRLVQYEVSAYAVPGHASRHNINYWRFGDYLGIGAGAHGKISFPADDKILRTRKLKQPGHYLNAHDGWNAEIVEVEPQQRSLEYLMNVLRLRKGFTAEQFEHGTGLTFDTIAKRVEYLARNNLVSVTERRDGRYYSASDAGYRVLNSLLEEFI